jgi:tetratricopeptide (TPR) repeat protein
MMGSIPGEKGFNPMAKRQEPKRKTPLENLEDLRSGHQEAASDGYASAQRYLDKVLSAQNSLPNAVKFFAYDLLVEASYHAGNHERCLEAIASTRQYLSAAQEDAPRELQAYMQGARYLERGIGVLADRGDIDAALTLCDEAIALGLGRAYEAKRQSLERRL